MKFTKFGKALSIGALSAGVVFGVTSCVESYSVGYLYVTGTVTASTSSNGIISGYKIEHNTGKLYSINGLPTSSGGANPVRAVLGSGSKFLYVLNRGASSSGSSDCYGTGANECQNANIVQFVVGGNGVLTSEETFYSQGLNPFRMLLDSSGSYLFVLDHDSPDNANASSGDSCMRAGLKMTTCGDITVFKIDGTTGRLSLVLNSAVSASNSSSSYLTYFPVPANPVDFVSAGNIILTLFGSNTPTSYPYTGGSSVWPYNYTSSTGQLTVSANGSQTLTNGNGNVSQANALVYASNVLYVLDNESVTTTFNHSSVTALSQIIPYTVSSAGMLQIEPSGVIPDDATLSNPIALMVDAKGQYVYVANQGNNTTGNNPESGIAAYYITTSPSYQLSYVADEPFGSGSGPQCIVEDPSSQYIFEANQYDSTITGRVIDPNSGELKAMRSTGTYTLSGQPSWCLVDGRTD
jgi:hypothetical protein